MKNKLPVKWSMTSLSTTFVDMSTSCIGSVTPRAWHEVSNRRKQVPDAVDLEWTAWVLDWTERSADCSRWRSNTSYRFSTAVVLKLKHDVVRIPKSCSFFLLNRYVADVTYDCTFDDAWCVSTCKCVAVILYRLYNVHFLLFNSQTWCILALQVIHVQCAWIFSAYT